MPKVTPKIPSAIPSIVDGQPLETGSAVTKIPCISPADETVLAELIEADAGAVDIAVAAARRAFDHGPWSGMSVADRQRILMQIRQQILDHATELARLECMDAGLPLQSVTMAHVPRAAMNFSFFAEVIGQEAGETYTQTAPYLSYVTREPAGVGALIGPWNMSLGLCTMKIASCIDRKSVV